MRAAWDFAPLGLRVRLALGSLLLVGNTLLELVGLGMIFPIVKLLQDQAFIEHNKYAAMAAQFFGVTEAKHLVIAICLLLVGIVIFRSVYSISLQYWIAKSLARYERRTSIQLCAAYLNAPLPFLNARKTADIVHNISYGVTQAYSNTLLPSLNLCAEFILLSTILVLVLTLNPGTALIAVLIIAIFGALYRLGFSKYIARVSSQWFASMKAGSHLLLECLGGISEVKTFAKQKYFLRQFDAYRSEFARQTYTLKCLQLIPRAYVEILVVIGISAFVIVNINAMDNADMVGLLALYGIVTLRLMPSVTRILTLLNEIKTSSPSILALKDEIDEMRDVYSVGGLRMLKELHRDDPIEQRRKFARDMTVRGLGYRYPGADYAVQDISFEIARGQSIGIVGASGAGKSTLASVILGLLPLQAGSITIDGQKVDAEASAAARSMSYVPQHIFLLNDTIRANIAFGIMPSRIDEGRMRQAAKMAQLEDLIDSMPDGYDTIVGERGVRLSGGQRQRVGIARAFYTDAQIIVLDEATSALDVETETLIADVLTNIHGDRTLIIIAHRLSTIRNCDKLLLLKDGRIIATGTFQSLIASSPDFANMVKLASLEVEAAV
jgi:ATP-binding cassette subfamily C protein